MNKRLLISGLAAALSAPMLTNADSRLATQLRPLSCHDQPGINFRSPLHTEESSAYQLESEPHGAYSGAALRARYGADEIPLARLEVDKPRSISSRFDMLVANFETIILQDALLSESIEIQEVTIRSKKVLLHTGRATTGPVRTALHISAKETHFDLFFALVWPNASAEEVAKSLVTAVEACTPDTTQAGRHPSN